MKMLVCVLASVVLWGCAFSSGDDDNDNRDGATVDGASDAVVSGMTYDELRESLNPRRTVFKERDIRVVEESEDTRFYWISDDNGTELHSVSVADDIERDYPTIPVENRTLITSYDVGDNWIVTAKLETGLNQYTYRAYPADNSGDFVEVSYTLPTTGSANTYDVDGDNVYILVFDEAANDNALVRWLPGQGADAVETVLTFRGSNVNVPDLIHGLIIQDGRMVIFEQGRLRSTELANASTLVIHATDEVDALLDANTQGVLYLRDNALAYYDYDNSDYVNVASALEALTQIVPERDSSHHPSSEHGGRLMGREVVYVGNNGLFAFHTQKLSVRACLLEALGPFREEYRRPQPMSTGEIFLLSLESESGSVGASGPVYRIK